MSGPLLHTQDLAVGYGGKPLLRDIALSVRAGQILTLIGPNGAGKSTVLKSLARQLEPLAGTVWLEQKSMSSMREGEIARSMSILMTERVQPELMTCEEVVRSGRYPYTGRLGILSPRDREKVREAMERVHVFELRDRDFNRVSDGQRQRVMLARAICQEPRVLVMDEPTSYLDIRHKLELLSLLKQLVRERGLAVILSLHELDLAQKCSDLLLCIREGKVDRLGTPEEIFTGDYIRELYGMTCGSYNWDFGALELEPPQGVPRIFVVGGGGSGIPIYRSLQRRGIPFAAGVLQANDLDWPVAKALAAKVIGERAFEPVSEAALEQAMEVLDQCESLICCPDTFGTMNQRNQRLVERARQNGKLTDIDRVSGCKYNL